ncbi:LysR substrate-binding domain-containing protein [Litoribrevibacter euphylliae]|uniref:LysR substrate-binding domain-containing protein n=1 Tax=Litoribrevibacter euphylliae TaxID=1834034 RepID=A0ABV7HG19_9GAMM
MIDDLKALAIFAETVKQGSFRAAASHFGLSPSVVSHHVTSLETKLGTTLLYRTTRALRLTDQGALLYQHAQAMLESAETGFNLLMEKGSLMGNLTISIPLLLSRSGLVKRLSEFSAMHPKVHLNIVATDQRVDLLQDHVDLALRLGSLADSGMKSRSLGEIPRSLVCSADFLDAYGELPTVEHLAQCPWVGLSMMKKSRTISKGDQQLVIQYDSQIDVNTVDLLTEFCIQGVGIATPPTFLISRLLESGTLVELFPEWRVEPIQISAVWLSSGGETPLIRALIDFMAEETIV